MNEENNFSFLNNENNEPNNLNPEPQPQPVPQDIFSGSPTPTPEPAPIENLESSGVVENNYSSTQIDPTPINVETTNNYTDNTYSQVQQASTEPANNFTQQYTEPQTSYEPINTSEKKKLNPKFLIIIFIVIAAIIAGIFLLKGCSTGYGKKSSKYPNKYNNTMYYKVSDSEIYEIKYYEDKDFYTISDSTKKYFDRREYYPGEYKNVRYFGVDIKFINKDSLTSECAKAYTCDNAYEEYNEQISYTGSYRSNTDEGINTKKINGREYKYFIGHVVKDSDLTYDYVVYQTKITDDVYYLVTYYGGVELTEEKLQGFLNIKVNKLKSESDIKNKDGLEWY